MFLDDIEQQQLREMLELNGVTPVLEAIASIYEAKDNIPGAFVASEVRDASDTIENILGEDHERKQPEASGEAATADSAAEQAPV